MVHRKVHVRSPAFEKLVDLCCISQIEIEDLFSLRRLDFGANELDTKPFEHPAYLCKNFGCEVF